MPWCSRTPGGVAGEISVQAAAAVLWGQGGGEDLGPGARRDVVAPGVLAVAAVVPAEEDDLPVHLIEGHGGVPPRRRRRGRGALRPARIVLQGLDARRHARAGAPR